MFFRTNNLSKTVILMKLQKIWLYLQVAYGLGT